MLSKLTIARAKLAVILAAGRPKPEKVKVWCSNGRFRFKTILGFAPSRTRLAELAEESAKLGLEIAALERARGELRPRLAPRMPQKPPSTRPDRIARTPRTGRWGFGLTPAYQGRRTASPEKLEDAAEWSRTTMEEVNLPMLVAGVVKAPKEHYSLGFVPRGGKRSGKRKRPSRDTLKKWTEERLAILAGEKKRLK